MVRKASRCRQIQVASQNPAFDRPKDLVTAFECEANTGFISLDLAWALIEYAGCMERELLVLRGAQ